MICFTDNDILFKLAACNLLDEALDTLGYSRSDVYVLPTVKDRFGAKKWAKAVRVFGEDTAVRIRDFLATVKVLGDPIPIEETLKYKNVSGIQPGELILLLSCRRTPGSHILTGDHNCIRALACDPVCEELAMELHGRLIYLIHLLFLIIEIIGFDYVKSRVVPAISCDKALRSLFGSGVLAEESNVRFGISSYINEIRDYPIDLIGDIGCHRDEPGPPEWPASGS